jgi:hypothetical protein
MANDGSNTTQAPMAIELVPFGSMFIPPAITLWEATEHTIIPTPSYSGSRVAGNFGRICLFTRDSSPVTPDKGEAVGGNSRHAICR